MTRKHDEDETQYKRWRAGLIMQGAALLLTVGIFGLNSWRSDLQLSKATEREDLKEMVKDVKDIKTMFYDFQINQFAPLCTRVSVLEATKQKRTHSNPKSFNSLSNK